MLTGWSIRRVAGMGWLVGCCLLALLIAARKADIFPQAYWFESDPFDNYAALLMEVQQQLPDNGVVCFFADQPISDVFTQDAYYRLAYLIAPTVLTLVGEDCPYALFYLTRPESQLNLTTLTNPWQMVSNDSSGRLFLLVKETP